MQFRFRAALQAVLIASSMLAMSAATLAQTPVTPLVGSPADTSTSSSTGARAGPGQASIFGAEPPVLGLRPPDDSVARGWTMAPTIGFRVEATDNALRSSSDKTSDVYFELFPGIAIRGASPALRFDATYVGLVSEPLRDSTPSRQSNTFFGASTLEAVERTLFVDASAAVSQQYLSSFGPRQSEIGGNDANRFESRAATVSPYLRGGLPESVQYYLRYSHTWSVPSARSTTLPSSQIDQVTGQVQGRATSSTGWLLDYTGTQTDADNLIAPRKMQRFYGTLSWRIDPEVTLFGLFGGERNNFIADREANTTYGGGASWIPTSRTRVEAKAERRFFGSGYALSFQHRLRQLATSVQISRDAVLAPSQLYFVPEGDARALLDAALTSTYPDPVQRRAAVDQIIAQTGTSAGASNTTSFFTQRVLLQRRIGVGLAMIGVRNTIAVDWSWLDSSALPDTQIAVVSDDFLISQNLRQTSGSITWTHHVSALTSITSRASRSVTRSIGLAEPRETTQDALTINAVNRLGARTNASVGLRVVQFDRSSNLGTGFLEKAVFGGLTHAF